MSEIVNVAAYKFTRLDNLTNRRDNLRTLCRNEGLKGTILLSDEGINLFVAGSREGVDVLIGRLRGDSQLADLQIKESLSKRSPFRRMLVKIKQEIIAFGVDEIDPVNERAETISPAELKEWLDQHRPVTLLDVRNDYEVQLGTFQGAAAIGVDHFRQFPDAVKQLPSELKQRPIVMFCTGGIRCEKAGPYMLKQGFRNVFQLDGGILKYFEQCGGEHYRGDCFVFDQRVALDSELNETDAALCFACQEVLTVSDQQSPHYVPGESCPHCYRSTEERMQETIARRHRQIRDVTFPLPGSICYENRRPMHVPARLDGQQLIEFLVAIHPQVPRDTWQQRCESGRLQHEGRALQAGTPLRAGQRIEHVIPETVEPDVNADILILYEDSHVIAVNKPAPLPMHPCGRYNRNTLADILRKVYRPKRVRVVHRLDANTTGVVVLALTREVAAKLQTQFDQQTVQKEYIARVQGQPDHDVFECDAPIETRPVETGARRTSADGLPARTSFRVLQRFADDTALVLAKPLTGRTNQIRLHLAGLGWPIRGDATYGRDGSIGSRQTLAPTDSPLCLHAWKIQLCHPDSGSHLKFQAPPPDWAEPGIWHR